jgi:hypothetical protein
MKRKVQPKLKQKQRQSQSVKVIVTLPEKKQRRRRTYKPKKTEEEPQLFRQLPPVVYMTPPQVTNYIIPQDRPTERPSITEIKTIPNPREKVEPKTMSFTAEIIQPVETPAMSPQSQPAMSPQSQPAMSAPQAAMAAELKLGEKKRKKKKAQPDILEEFIPAAKAEQPAIMRKSIPKKKPTILYESEDTENEQYPFAIATPYNPPEKPTDFGFGIEGYTSPKESTTFSPRKGRPPAKYSYLALATKSRLQEIYTEEFGKEPPMNMGVKELRDAIRKKLSA